MALAAIYQGISEDTLLQLGAKKTACEAWNMLKTMNLGAERVKEVRTQTMWREIEAMRMNKGDNIDDFIGKLQIIVNKLRGLGNVVEEEMVVKKLLRSTSTKFLQITSTIEEFGDLKTKTMEDVIGSLKAHEERLQGGSTMSEDTVFLTRADWKGKDDSKHHKKVFRDTRNGRRGRGRGYGKVGVVAHLIEEKMMVNKKENLISQKSSVMAAERWVILPLNVHQKKGMSKRI